MLCLKASFLMSCEINEYYTEHRTTQSFEGQGRSEFLKGGERFEKNH